MNNWFNPFEGKGGGGGSASITIDNQVQEGSTNPVENGAIYNYVNSSVATNTANFIDTFDSLSDLENYSGVVTNNDYAFVVSVDDNGNTVYNRYKWSEEDSQWKFEYTLNNSSFTATQWATIQSGITASDKAKLNTIEENANNYILPAATSSKRGGVVVGEYLLVQDDVISIDSEKIPTVEITAQEVQNMWNYELIPLIPQMTSASDDTGIVSYGNNYGSGSYGTQNPWLPFDGYDSTYLMYQSEFVDNGWIQYEFNQPTYVAKIKSLFGNYQASNNISATLYIYDENDNEFKVSTIKVTGYNEGSYGEYEFKVNQTIKKFKFIFGYKSNATNIMTHTIQAYGTVV